MSCFVPILPPPGVTIEDLEVAITQGEACLRLFRRFRRWNNSRRRLRRMSCEMPTENNLAQSAIRLSTIFRLSNR